MQHVLDVVARRAVADTQRACDVARAVAVGEQPQNLQLPSRELTPGVIGRMAPPPGSATGGATGGGGGGGDDAISEVGSDSTAENDTGDSNADSG